MDTFIVTFEVVAALLGIGLLGFWIIGRKKVPSSALGLLSAIAINIALPCIVLSNILNEFTPQQYPDWWHMPLWWAGFTVVALILSLSTAQMARHGARGEFAMTVFYQNGIFFPLIIINGLFGPDANKYLVQLFLFIFLQPTLVFTTYPLFIRRIKSPESSINWRRVVNSMLVMTVIGVAIGLLGWNNYVPDFIMMILVMIGAMAAPLFMLILGGNIYNDFINKEQGGNKLEPVEILKFIIAKNVIFPLVFLGLLILLKPDFTIALIVILQAAVPPITGTPIFVERLGANRAIANQYIVGSFVFSIISIPLIFIIFTRYFPFPS
jgi:malate permease and related proteins